MIPVNVMIVEDDPMVLAVNQRFTERLGGFRVVGAARDGAQALQAIRSSPPSLVLLDIYLPDMSGMTVLREIRNEGLDVDVILISAAQDADTVQAGLRFGACDYLIKPFTFDRFRQAMTTYVLRRSRLRPGNLLSQQSFDGLFNEARPSLKEPPPKGIDPGTLTAFVRELERAAGPLSATDLARRLGVSRITAVRYLRYLCDCDQLVIQPVYGAVGRPVKTFRLRSSKA